MIFGIKQKHSNYHDCNMTKNAKAPFTAVQVVICSAAAGGLAWGIRGQYGHESGAMITGVLLGFFWVLAFLPNASILQAARLVSMCALGISFGGCMTYGQTLGLTHDIDLVGNKNALYWGMLGLGIKGAVWWGFLGAFIGFAVSPIRYKPSELLVLLVVGLHLMFLGMFLLNSPYKPEDKILPWIYFSDHWDWEPLKELKPRGEKWGGLWLALIGILFYVSRIRKDRFTRNLVLWGCLAGGMGFPTGQCLQAFHAWNPSLFKETGLGEWTLHVNWWNAMEILFGTIAGGVLGWGLWCQRNQIRIESTTEDPKISIPLSLEWCFVLIYLPLFLMWNFISFPALDGVADQALSMGLIPVFAIMGGRLWPLIFGPWIVLLPITGKTLRYTAFENDHISIWMGTLFYILLPVALMTGFCWVAWSASKKKLCASDIARPGLVCFLIACFYLNFAFFEFPWPWLEWTYRTPSTVVFLLFACILGCAVIRSARIKTVIQPGSGLDGRSTNQFL